MNDIALTTKTSFSPLDQSDDCRGENSWAAALTARNVKAWAIGPGGPQVDIFLALKARNDVRRRVVTVVVGDSSVFRAFSASKVHSLQPGVLPQAFTFRALGAEELKPPASTTPRGLPARGPRSARLY